MPHRAPVKRRALGEVRYVGRTLIKYGTRVGEPQTISIRDMALIAEGKAEQVLDEREHTRRERAAGRELHDEVIAEHDEEIARLRAEVALKNR